MKTLFLSNTNLDPVIKKLVKKYSDVAFQNGFDTWLETLLSITPEKTADCIFVILDGFALYDKYGDEKDFTTFFDRVFLSFKNAALGCTSLFVSQIEVPDNSIFPHKISQSSLFESQWNERLDVICTSNKNVYPFDMKEWVAEAGRENVYSMKLWYLGGIRYSAAGQAILLRRICETIEALCQRRKKCLILDADNTLWGGILGEDGRDGIELAPYGAGSRYYHFQRAVHEILLTGVICALVTKNNEAEIRETLATHPHMVLREDSFVSIHANWNDKASEIVSLSKELNLPTDSFVFIDDSVCERELVRQCLPGVTVPEFPADSAELALFAHTLFRSCFYTLGTTDDDRSKTAQYIMNSFRNSGMHPHGDLKSFLETLKIQITAKRAGVSDIPRLVQLCQKTNQFNLTTIRYGETEIAGLLNDPAVMIFIFSAADRFGTYGSIAAGIVNIGKVCVIDSFMMSCRAMGRNMEYGILSFLLSECEAAEASSVDGIYIATEKNIPARDFYSSAGFSSSGSGRFSIQLPAADTGKFIGEVVRK